MEGYENADSNYLSQGVHILELAQKACSLYEKAESAEKRKLLNFLLSNCTFTDGNLNPTYRKPFDLLTKSTDRLDWHAKMDTIRTFFMNLQEDMVIPSYSTAQPA